MARRHAGSRSGRQERLVLLPQPGQDRVSGVPTRVRARHHLTTEELLEHFRAHADYEIDFAENWFDDEIGRLFGIDVFTEPFPHDTGFAVIDGERVRVLVLRVETLTESLPVAIEAFLGIPDVRPLSANRNHREIYTRFLEQAAVPAHYVDRVYSSRLARHFYTPDELASFKARWTRVGP